MRLYEVCVGLSILYPLRWWPAATHCLACPTNRNIGSRDNACVITPPLQASMYKHLTSRYTIKCLRRDSLLPIQALSTFEINYSQARQTGAYVVHVKGE